MSEFWFWVLFGAVVVLALVLSPAARGCLVVSAGRYAGPLIAVRVISFVFMAIFIVHQPGKAGELVGDIFRNFFGTESTATASAPATSTPVTPAGWDARTGTPLPAWDCPEGNVCFWNGADGTGSRCTWDLDDRDWRDGNVICSWSETDDVRSVLNNGNEAMAVVYYRQANFRGGIGCAEPGRQTNLPAATPIRAHKWIDGACPAPR